MALTHQIINWSTVNPDGVPVTRTQVINLSSLVSVLDASSDFVGTLVLPRHYSDQTLLDAITSLTGRFTNLIIVNPEP